MKESQRKNESFATSINLGWRKSELYDENFDKIFMKKLSNECIDCKYEVNSCNGYGIKNFCKKWEFFE